MKTIFFNAVKNVREISTAANNYEIAIIFRGKRVGQKPVW